MAKVGHWVNTTAEDVLERCRQDYMKSVSDIDAELKRREYARKSIPEFSRLQLEAMRDELKAHPHHCGTPVWLVEELLKAGGP